MLHSGLWTAFAQDPIVTKTFEAQDLICYRNAEHKTKAAGSKCNLIILLVNLKQGILRST